MSRTKQILITVLLTIFVTTPTFADWKENATAIDVSGGEDHTLVLTANKWAWGCGNNYYYQLGIGSNVTQLTLVRVAKGDMNSPSDSLENIDDVDAGWTHSLALDVNGFVWSWGWSSQGQLGNGKSGNFLKDFA